MFLEKNIGKYSGFFEIGTAAKGNITDHLVKLIG